MASSSSSAGVRTDAFSSADSVAVASADFVVSADSSTPASTADGERCSASALLPCARSSGTATVVTCAVLAYRPRLMPT